MFPPLFLCSYKEAGFAHLADVAVSSANAYQAATADF